jgi:RNA polymerase sigma-70 factor (ECF subfamily)
MTGMTFAAADTMTSVSKTFSAPLFRYLLRGFHGTRQSTEDLLQETMLHAWRSFSSLPEEHEQRRRWLFTIARNVGIDAERRRRLRPEPYGGLDLNLVPGRTSVEEQVVAVHSVRQALADLPAIHREVIVALYYRGLTVAETAEQLDIPIGTVKSRAHNGLRAMREQLT